MITHSSIHFSCGMLAGIIVFLPAVINRWKTGKPLFRLLLMQFLCSIALAALAASPSLLTRIGFPEEIFNHPAGNLFFFYPFINSLFSSGGTYSGPAMMFITFGIQYCITVIAVFRAESLSVDK